LKDFKCEFKGENNEEEGVRVCSLACCTSRVKGVYWSFEMGTRTNDKHFNYSHELAQTKQQIG
jgi:hypothetical protein